jgi:pilus assembly protein CpaF
VSAAVDVEIASADGTRTVKALGGPLITVGRGSDATIVLKHDDVSRRHASVELNDNGIVIRDLSTNGTFVDGRRVVGEVPVPFNRPVRVGPFTLRFRPAGTPAPPHTRTLVGEVKPPPPPQPLRQSNSEQPKIIADGARLSDSVELPPPKKKPQGAPLIVMPRASAPPVVVAKPGGPVMPLKQTPSPNAPLDVSPTHRAAPLDTPGNRAPKPAERDPASDLSDHEHDRLKRWLRGLLLESLELPSLRPEELHQQAPRVLTLIDELLDENARELPPRIDRARLKKELADEVLALGPLEELLADASVTEVMVVDRATIYVERAGKLALTGARFSSEDALRAAIERMVTPLGRHLDESTPLVDARLPDGTRINAIVPPLALRGPCLTLRKPATARPTIHDLVNGGVLDPRMARFLLRAVAARRNILV